MSCLLRSKRIRAVLSAKLNIVSIHMKLIEAKCLPVHFVNRAQIYENVR